MTEAQQLAKTTSDFAHILAELNRLSRDLLLTFRLEAGKVFLDNFFAGSARAYQDKNPGKEASFAEFSRVCKDDLSDLGISHGVARQCILARIAWDGLPHSVREGLKFNHVAALARVDEPNLRARLAFDATRLGWTVLELEDAIVQAADGRYFDTDPLTPGTQPPQPLPTAEKGYQPGRLVSQLVKAGEDLASWRQAWATVDGRKLRGAQRQRMAEALAVLKAQVAELEVELLAGGE